ncbi:MAG: VanZ family protein [Erysipelotrichaceae bacterium]|jgi:O-antigen biosynthesis protein WbqP|nr:VanZ family protein [Erysipelotrichaceae bacterium]
MKRKFYLFFKRLFDIIFSIIGILLFSPLILIILIVGLFVYRGKPIFKQKRVGLNSKLFSIYKFRTMSLNAPSNLKTSDIDPTKNYINGWGKFLRKTSLDELAQFFNILNGTMSFVGPRPLIESEEVNTLRKERHIDDVKPGVTGWAQVNGRDTLSAERKISLDEVYHRHASLFFDVKIMFLTVAKVIFRKDVVDGEIDVTQINSVKSHYLKSKKSTKAFFAVLLVGWLIVLMAANLQSGSSSSSLSMTFTKLFDKSEDLGSVFPEHLTINKAFPRSTETYLVGATHKYSVYLEREAGIITEGEVCYEIDKKEVGTIGLYDAVFTAIAPGTATIKAYMLENKEIYNILAIEVIEPKKPDSLDDIFYDDYFTLSRMPDATLATGFTGQINLNLKEGLYNKDVTFISDNETILTVNQEGLVRGVSPGNASVRVASSVNLDLYFEINITVTAATKQSTTSSNALVLPSGREHYQNQILDFDKIVTFDGDDTSYTLSTTSTAVLVKNNTVKLLEPTDAPIVVRATSNQNPMIFFEYEFKVLATKSIDFRFNRANYARVVNGARFYPALEFGYLTIHEDGTEEIVYTIDIFSAPGSFVFSSSDATGVAIYHNGVVSLKRTGAFTVSSVYRTETGEEIKSEMTLNIVSTSFVSREAVFRKLFGHFGVFVVFGILILINIFLQFERYPKTFYRSLITGIPLAFIFESFQFFTSGRNPAFVDCLINASGIVAGVILAFILLGLYLLSKIKKIEVKKYLYISSFYESMTKNKEGERIKAFSIYKILNSNVFLLNINLNRYKYLNAFSIAIYTRLMKFDKIIISKAVRGGDIILRILKRSKVPPENIIYFTLNNHLSDKLMNESLKYPYYRELSKIIVETDLVKTSLDNLGFKNVFCLPNFKRMYEIEDTKEFTPKTVLNLVYFSRISRGKGIFDLIPLIKKINRRKVLFTLEIFGNGTLENINRLKELINGDKNVTYSGFLTLDSSFAYKKLNEFDLNIFPTMMLDEGIPGTFIDMFIASVPSLTSDFANARFFLSDANSFFFRQGDFGDLKTKLLNVYENQRALFLKRPLVKQEKDKYSVTTFTEKMLELLK